MSNATGVRGNIGASISQEVGSTSSVSPSTPTTRMQVPGATGVALTAFQYSPRTRTLPVGDSAVSATPTVFSLHAKAQSTSAAALCDRRLGIAWRSARMPLADAVMTASLPILGIGTIIISLDIYRDLRRSASPFYGVADEFGEVLLSQPELRGIMKGLSQK